MLPTRIAIIGPAGRSLETAKQLKEVSFDTLVSLVRDEIEDLGLPKDRVCLVSGGAAWCDHVAVQLFLEGELASGLELFLPCKWGRGRFSEGLEGKGVARAANFYHERFNKMCGCDSLVDIAKAIEKGAKLRVFDGFSARNTQIARTATLLLAFTLDGLMSSGTRNTWTKAKCKKIELPVGGAGFYVCLGEDESQDLFIGSKEEMACPFCQRAITSVAIEEGSFSHAGYCIFGIRGEGKCKDYQQLLGALNTSESTAAR